MIIKNFEILLLNYQNFNKVMYFININRENLIILINGLQKIYLKCLNNKKFHKDKIYK